MFTKEELLVIEDALKIADEKYIKLLDESKNNKNSAWTSVIFTKSYIVIDITGEDYKNRKMYIYSYGGKLIREVNVQPVW